MNITVSAPASAPADMISRDLVISSLNVQRTISSYYTVTRSHFLEGLATVGIGLLCDHGHWPGNIWALASDSLILRNQAASSYELK